MLELRKQDLEYVYYSSRFRPRRNWPRPSVDNIEHDRVRWNDQWPSLLRQRCENLRIGFLC